jgi:hypothetical protein
VASRPEASKPFLAAQGKLTPVNPMLADTWPFNWDVRSTTMRRRLAGDR